MASYCCAALREILTADFHHEDRECRQYSAEHWSSSWLRSSMSAYFYTSDSKYEDVLGAGTSALLLPSGRATGLDVGTVLFT